MQRRTPTLGFDLSNLAVPREALHHGGPPKDGIPALSQPAVVQATAAEYLQDDDRVIGVVFGAESRAYPLRILNLHEIVNDVVGGQALAATYCPLCDSAIVFDRRTPLGEREFGVSGLLFNSNVLMYDRAQGPESLWSQMRTAGISGPGAGHVLRTLPLELTTWSSWKRRYPRTTVLSSSTGHQREYRRNPYASYFAQPGLMFPAAPLDDRLPVKEPVLGVWTASAARAFPASAFGERATVVRESFTGQELAIEYVPQDRTLRVLQAGADVQWAYCFWFAWFAFHPDTTIYGSP